MVVVTVARKPLSEPTVAQNALVSGTGAVNVDGSRISTSTSEPDSGAMFYKNRGAMMPENRHNYFGGEDGVALSKPIDGGRWPANLVLQHLGGCQQVGGAGVGREGRRARDVGSERHDGRESYRLRNGVQSAPKGREGEAVPEWDCEPGCPVKGLDDQAGPRWNGGNTGRARSSGGTSIFGSASGLEPDGVVVPHGYTQASRYFKQVK